MTDSHYHTPVFSTSLCQQISHSNYCTYSLLAVSKFSTVDTLDITQHDLQSSIPVSYYSGKVSMNNHACQHAPHSLNTVLNEKVPRSPTSSPLTPKSLRYADFTRTRIFTTSASSAGNDGLSALRTQSTVAYAQQERERCFRQRTSIDVGATNLQNLNDQFSTAADTVEAIAAPLVEQ